MHYHRSLNSSASRLFRILRIDLFHHQSLRNSLRNPYALGGGDHGPDHRRGIDNPVDRFVSKTTVDDTGSGLYDTRHQRQTGGSDVARSSLGLRRLLRSKCEAYTQHEKANREFDSSLHITSSSSAMPPAPAPAAYSANTAVPQSESRSNTPDISSSSDQAASLPGSSAPPARSPASPQRNRSPKLSERTTRRH